MGFTKITDADLIDKGVIGLPDQPGLSTAAMQNKLEETARGVIIPKHNGLIDELHDTTAAGNVGAVAPTGFTGTTVQSLIDELASGAGSAVKDAYKNIESGGTTFSASGEDTFKINAGSNVTITPLASPDKGIQISAAGGGTSTGDMLMADYDNDGSVKSASSTGNGIKDYVASAISGKSNVGHTHTKSEITDFPTLGTAAYLDVAATGDASTSQVVKGDDSRLTDSRTPTSHTHVKADITDFPTIPSALSDLTDDSTHRVVTDTEKTAWSGKSTVSWNQQVTTGQQIATVTIDGTSVNVFAPTGGGGGGGNVDSVNGKQGTVVLDLGDMDDVTFTGVAQNDAVVRNGSNQWVNIPLPLSALTGSYADLKNKPSLATVATSGSYNDLSNKPTIPSVVSTYSSTGTDAVNGTAVANALGTLDVTDTAVSGQYVSAVSETDGKISVTRASLPTVPDELKDLTGDVSITTPSNGDVLTYDTSSSKWTAQAPASGGHTMINNSGYESTMVTHAADPTDDDVASAYVIANWSNCAAKVILTTVAQGDDTVGQWNDTWKTDGVRTGWLWSADLYHVLEDGSGNRNYDVEVIPVFDAGDSETISLYGYRIDDDVTNGGTPGGAIAFKLNSAVQSATGVKVGVKLVLQRTEVNPTGTIIT